ncbi:MAG: 30S ribosomal protein S1 [Deltaproteobacteria bacterium]|nr:30S ribosomal protein S1 [Deltaproteobacteria bacterium]
MEEPIVNTNNQTDNQRDPEEQGRAGTPKATGDANSSAAAQQALSGKDDSVSGADGNASRDSETREDDVSMESMDMKELYEESLRSLQEGEVIAGTVIQVTKDFVVVDVGYKSEGQISISEFLDEQGEAQVAVGDTIDVLLERREDEDGEILLSKEKAAKIKVWDDIRRAYNEGQVIKGAITARVKGGFTVDIGVPAFLPGSQVDLRPVKDMDSLVNKTFEFQILKYNKKRSNVVISRRAILEQHRQKARETTLKKIQEQDVLIGIVKNITDYGAFIDLGGLDGLLHITDMSWGRVKHPSELIKIGDEVKVKVLNFDQGTERVSLGMKQLQPDPWTTASEKYPPSARIQGRVVSLTDYGAFVEVEEGIEGLIHLSEMSWTKKIRHPSMVVNVGDEVEAMVLDIDPTNRRISLGLKQVEPNPWDVIGEKYPVGTIIEGKIKNITDFGVFIGIDEGIDGLVHISDLSWTKRVKHPSELFKKGQEVQAKVLKIDRENERFSLSIKHVTPDPWEEIPRKYKVGSRISGTITNVTDFGIFVEVEPGIEGLIHVSEISAEKVKTPVGQFNVGDVVTAKVVNVNRKERKIGLSLRRLEEESDKATIRDYLSGSSTSFPNLGDLLKESREANQQQSDPDDSTEE